MQLGTSPNSKMVEFNETTYKGVTFKLDEVHTKKLQLAIPPSELTTDQANVLQEIKDYAIEKGIEFIVQVVE